MQSFNDKLKVFIDSDFKLRHFSQELYEEVLEKLHLDENMAYESFFSSFFLSTDTQLKFIKLCHHYGYGPFDEKEDKLIRVLNDIYELREIQGAMFPNYKEV